MSFTGFTEEQFRVFELPGFAERMMAIRSIVRPQLLALGEELSPALSKLAGHPLYPHVALHARRRVNPPDDTWAAFGRAERGYKAYAHFAVGIDAAGIYCGLVLKDESGDKEALGRALSAHAGEAAELCRRLKGYSLEELKNPDAAGATVESICRLADALINRKSSTFHLERHIRRTDKRLADPEAVIKLARDLCKPLKPFYRWAAGG